MSVGFSVLVGAVELVFVADGVIGFLFAWELMALVNAALVTTEHERRDTRRAAFLYLAMSHVATGCLIGGFLLLAGGRVLPELRARPRARRPPAGAGAACRVPALLRRLRRQGRRDPAPRLAAEAHPAAPTSISALMSGVVIKTGIYGLVRVCAFGLGEPPLAWGVLVLVCGGASAILGVLYALMQHDLKRLLAYHSIENIGIILLGLGAGMMALSAGRPELAAVGIAASLFHVLNHALFKGLLFLGAGGVVVATGTRHIEELGGLAKRMPWTALFFLVGAAAISGLPAAQRLRERVAALPGVPVRLPSLLGSPRALPVSGGGGALGADERAGGGVFREGVRDHVPGAAAGRGGREGARVDRR